MGHRTSWIAAALLVLLAGCQKSENYPNPKPGVPAPPAGGEAPAAPAPSAAAPAPGAPAAPANVSPTVAAALKIQDPGAAAVTEANTKFSSLCFTCHGPTGAGDGPAAAAFPVKPRNYHDKTWQAATSDTEIMTAILEGGAAVGKSPLMPPNPDLQSKPDVLAALKNKVREFGK